MIDKPLWHQLCRCKTLVYDILFSPERVSVREVSKTNFYYILYCIAGIFGRGLYLADVAVLF